MKEKSSSDGRMYAQIPRRDFVRSAAAATVCLALDGRETAAAETKENPKGDLSTVVQMQFMRPGQLEKAIRDFSVVYVPFGPIEWHGRHLPLGTDALKAHGILVKTAEQFGGVVYPSVYFHEGFGQELASQAIGRKAGELLESLPEDQRSFKLPAISPGHWWMI